VKFEAAVAMRKSGIFFTSANVHWWW